MDDGMFGERAYLYDLIYAGKDYAAEARTLRGALGDHGIDEGASILEAACGTGSYLDHLRVSYDVAGFDLSAEMLDVARRKLDDVPLFVADMRDFSVDEPVDAVVCLFSSIGYIHGLEALGEVLANVRQAVRPGGVVVIEPWISPDALEVGQVWMQTYEDDDIKVCRQLSPARDGRLAVLDFHWLVGRAGEGVEHFTDRHELYMFTHDEYVEALEQAGFRVEYDDEGLTGRGMYVGVLDAAE